MASTAFPALAINTQGESPINLLGKVEQIRQSQQSQQMTGLQIQEAKIALQSRQTLMSIWAKNAGDPDQTLADISKDPNITPDDKYKFQTQQVALKTALLTQTKEQNEVIQQQNSMITNAVDSVKQLPIEQRGQAIKAAATDLASRGVDISKAIGQINTLISNPTDEAFKEFETAHMGVSWVADQVIKQKQAEEAGNKYVPTPQESAAQFHAGLTTVEEQAKEAGFKALQAQLTYLDTPTPEMAHSQQLANLRKTQAETNLAVANKAHVAAETALMAASPVYGTNPQTHEQTLVTRKDAQAQGLTNILPADLKQIRADSEVVKQVNVMQDAVSRYKVAMTTMSGHPPTDAHAQIMAALMSDKSLFPSLTSHVTGEGVTQAITALQKAKGFDELTQDERAAMIAYRRAQTAVPLGQKALTGTGRLNEAVMNLDMQLVPTPLEGPSAAEKLDAYQNNIDGAGIGLPDLSKSLGIPTQKMVRQFIENRR